MVDVNKIIGDSLKDYGIQRRREKRERLQARKGERQTIVFKVGKSIRQSPFYSHLTYYDNDNKEKLFVGSYLVTLNDCKLDDTGKIARKMEEFRKQRVKLQKEEQKYLFNAYHYGVK